MRYEVREKPQSKGKCYRVVDMGRPDGMPIELAQTHVEEYAKRISNALNSQEAKKGST